MNDTRILPREDFRTKLLQTGRLYVLADDHLVVALAEHDEALRARLAEAVELLRDTLSPNCVLLTDTAERIRVFIEEQTP